ncbi:phosphoglucomutase (alpha-D-glucose-1,6-bisphosphate-dependent) (plasmid) [Burkholderia sp. FERM BP-3421]|uniref:phosphoglucomutase (alpha-D-glucose-1,6-bisphosphate-dependent) n=1 Tax=Burkholderia sp. FERM BP-3421 TaxID=1494466 RepID=UPI00235E6345|nr:phosphoglucomutase (alpha-D-glucose-1,6-bisphosphate-dependent) [Burkholderia sp. FERM BP-3421]WDD90388.1 phosphoglucomutase (alpha-D-glucose-1,6-bisphosphate-dependent) [Burkholderia sp. FERM BP-3421]
MPVSPLAGRPAPYALWIDVPRLVTAYYTDMPDPAVPAQRVTFGTSGHRGSALTRSFNEWHVFAITQAICRYRRLRGIDGPLFLGIDTHALSEPAQASVLEVLAANGVVVMLAPPGEYTPTPAVSRAILKYNRGRNAGFADGMVVTPSHNPPDNGGIKYNPATGGPAGEEVTRWIEAAANELLEAGLAEVNRVSLSKASNAATTHRYDFLATYIDDLADVIDMDILRGAPIRLGVDPLGGAGVQYWRAIAECYHLNLEVLSEEVDPTFRFMSVDWDGLIRMDPSSPYAMQTLIARKDRFDVAFACDTDHDRHGIVTRHEGLLPANHYLAVLVDYLYTHRPRWPADAAVGKSVVSSGMIDRAARACGREVYEVPVGFKWFVDGLLNGTLGFAGEESAGATCLQLDGRAWTTDKDGIVPALLSAEMTVRTDRDPAELYRGLAHRLGAPAERRLQVTATRQQRECLGRLSPRQFTQTELAGDAIVGILDRAPGNRAAIGGIKVMTEHGWFVARPSGTEDLYRIYAESFAGEDHVARIVSDAQSMVDAVLEACLRPVGGDPDG